MLQDIPNKWCKIQFSGTKTAYHNDNTNERTNHSLKNHPIRRTDQTRFRLRIGHDIFIQKTILL